MVAYELDVKAFSKSHGPGSDTMCNNHNSIQYTRHMKMAQPSHGGTTQHARQNKAPHQVRTNNSRVITLSSIMLNVRGRIVP